MEELKPKRMIFDANGEWVCWDEVKKNFESLTKENDKLKARVKELGELQNEVQKVWNEDGDCGEIQMKTPIAWQRVIRISDKLLTPKN